MRYTILILFLSMTLAGCSSGPLFEDNASSENNQASSSNQGGPVAYASTENVVGAPVHGGYTYGTAAPQYNSTITAPIYSANGYAPGANTSYPVANNQPSYAGSNNGSFWSLPLNSYEHWLYRGYLSLAAYESREQDFDSAALFQDKAAQLVAGRLVDPEYPSRRGVPQDKLQELVNGRQRLMDSYLRGVTMSDPKQSAEAQVMFDCWVHEQAENFQPGDIARCRQGFCTRVARLQGAVCPKCGDTCSIGNGVACGDSSVDVCAVDPELVVVRREAPPAQERGPERFIVYFDFDKSNLNAEARNVVKELIDYVAAEKPRDILLYGNADTMGNKSYNVALGERRAKRVEKALVDSGYSRNDVHHLSYGETHLQVQTADEVRQRKNRRVEIELHWQDAIPNEFKLKR